MHKEYKRIVNHATKAILFIHGIIGTPDHFHFLLPLVPENISIHNLLLDGHGKGVREFSKTSIKKWEAQVALAVEDLAKQHQEIYIVAHSLGSLLAIEQAIKNEKVTKLFLLAVPLQVSVKPRMLRNTMRVYFDKIDPNDEELVAAKRCCGVVQSKNLLLYLGWIPRYLELFAKIRQIRSQVALLKTPCLACQSAKDEMVSPRAIRILETNPTIAVMELKNSGHCYYEKSDLARLQDAFADFLFT